ncbi:MAG: hypothetical protein RMK84_00795 [Oscillochloridaceae bacterium]|nr:hypothetical protein [Chloroflexaceae bacterium]MDW8388634.1 hypothetical protein [Oscillochloridaceae bacterium]
MMSPHNVQTAACPALTRERPDARQSRAGRQRVWRLRDIRFCRHTSGLRAPPGGVPP